MEFDVWQTDYDHNGKERDYLMAPHRSDCLTITDEAITVADGTSGISVDIPRTADFEGRMPSELAYIHHLEASESTRQKAVRKMIDWALDAPGSLVAGATSGMVVYDRTGKIWSSIVWGAVGAFGHEFVRRPFVGARHFFHQVTNPWTPAAQSTARIRRDVLEI